MLIWYGKNRGSKSPSPAGGYSEDSANAINHARRMNHWMDEAFRECEENGGFEYLEGKGKPVQVPEGDALNTILKNANVLPPWLELQHDIRDDIKTLLNKQQKYHLSPADMKQALDAINNKISQYNLLVPTPVLQKSRLSPDTLHQQLSMWE